MTTTDEPTTDLSFPEDWKAPEPALLERSPDTDQETTVTPPNPNKPVRPSGDIKRRMLAGEPLTGAQIAEEYGIHPSTLGNVVRELKTEYGNEAVHGHIIPGAGNPKRYQMVMPAGYDESQWGKGENVQSLRRKEGPNAPRAPKATEPKPAAAAPKPKRKGLPHPVPELGSSLAVNALTLTDDGVVALSIESDTGRWLVEVMAYAKREPDGGNTND